MNPYIKLFLKIFLIAMLIGVIVISLIFVGALYGLFGNNDDLGVDIFKLNYSSQVFYTDAETGEIKEYVNLSSVENRVWVDLEEIPDHLKDAIVSIEDERFYEHSGFDIRRTAKAFFVHIYNKVTGSPTSFGGSTITQQLIKNLTNEKEQTAARKIREISKAVILERQMEKDEILELYLNTIYLSQGCNGVQTASKTFFGKDVSELNLAECASIAGITQYPGLYDPLINPEKNKEKQEIVLKKMFELGKISEKEYEEAKNFKLIFAESSMAAISSGRVNSYFIDQVITEVRQDLINKGYSKVAAEKLLYSGGLKIYTTYDPKVQTALEKAYTDNNNFPGSGGAKGAQSAMIVIDPYTGGIKGLVGGIGPKEGNLVLNRTSTYRQPGSTIKPIAVYAPALERGIINAATIITDKPLKYGSWSPQNYDRDFKGPVTVRFALKKSLNTIPVQILEDLGAENSFDFLKNKLGVSSLVKDEVRADGKVYSDIGLSQLALGGLTDGISLRDLAGAYTPFVNKGIYSKPFIYTSVLDSDGNELLSNSSKKQVALSQENAYIMAQMLRDVVSSGTGGGAGFSFNYFIGGKTGTTDNNYDRWFVGFTPYYVAASWYGYDEQKPIPVSGNPCIPVWKNVMEEIHKDLPAKTIPMPKGVSVVKYCAKSGNLPGANCSEEECESFWFSKDNRPKTVCDGYHSESIVIPDIDENNSDETENTDENVIEIE